MPVDEPQSSRTNQSVVILPPSLARRGGDGDAPFAFNRLFYLVYTYIITYIHRNMQGKRIHQKIFFRSDIVSPFIPKNAPDFFSESAFFHLIRSLFFW
jgi:hypothetical protein